MDQLSLTFSALAHPTRRAILARLAQGETTVNELAKPFDLRPPTLSRHLKVLQRAGLVTQSRKAQWRPCRLEGAPIKEVAVWAETYRQFWERSFKGLDAVLDDLKRKRKKAPTMRGRRARDR
jgi:DNA-binding transcriptional ArsR family regulator